MRSEEEAEAGGDNEKGKGKMGKGKTGAGDEGWEALGEPSSDSSDMSLVDEEVRGVGTIR